MATYTVNRAAVRHARDLIAAKKWVLDSDWGDVQPDAAAGTRSTTGTSTGSTAPA
jgi:hypothetical protein